MSKPTVLLYGFEDREKLKRIQQAILPLHLKIRVVKPMEYECPVGTVAFGGSESVKCPSDADGEEENSKEKNGDENIAEAADSEGIRELMVMAGLNRQQLDGLLAALRRSGAGPVPYKAMLTEVNQFWSGFELYREICQEHEQMQQLVKARNSEQ